MYECDARAHVSIADVQQAVCHSKPQCMSTRRVVQDTSAACAALDVAVQKLQASFEFARGDVAPHNALGDAHASWADRLSGNEATAHLQQALQGYQQALHIDRTCTDAYVGIAEVHTRMGRLAVQQNAPGEALQYFSQAAEAYRRVLQWPTKLGKFQERCEIRYNCACVLSLCSRSDDAINLLRQLLQVKGVSANDLRSDTDFSNLSAVPAFVQLSQQLQFT